MSSGPFKVEWIKWGERTMTVRGAVWYLPQTTTLTVSYAHVAASRLFVDDGAHHLVFEAGPTTFSMHFQDEGNARDAAAELARRMEADR
jgi:hypothetical protein